LNVKAKKIYKIVRQALKKYVYSNMKSTFRFLVMWM
jgi:hypothetical protein